MIKKGVKSMSKRTIFLITKAKAFTINIYKKKQIIFCCIAILLVLSSTCIDFNSIKNKKILIAKNNYLTDSNAEISSSINDKIKNITKTSFDNVNLINDNRGVPVLYYHSVHSSSDNEVTITPENLKKQLKYIKDQGYITLTMNELKDYLLNNSHIPEKSILITFDDGYMNNYYNAFPILKDLDMVATIFCITSNLDGSYYLSKEAIIEMSNYGLDFESHTITHSHLDKLNYSDQLKELQDSKKTLESITGKESYAIAYPFGDFNTDTIEAAKNSGYLLGFTTNRGFSDRNDSPLKLDRIYISSNYNMDTFKEVLHGTKK